MDPLKREITIAKCPLCGLQHSYTLEYEEDFIVGFVIATTQPVKQFVVWLTCPNKNNPFQIVITTSGNVKWMREKVS
jgi:hypothetical protein